MGKGGSQIVYGKGGATLYLRGKARATLYRESGAAIFKNAGWTGHSLIRAFGVSFGATLYGAGGVRLGARFWS